MNRYWHGLVRRLDRPGRRRLLIAPASVWVSWRYRTLCVVYWRDGNWMHHYRGARIPHRELGRAAPPGVLTAEARDLFLWEYAPRPGDVVLDVGAGIGAETLLFSRLVGTSGRVVSFEAHPRTYRRLVDLCRVNRLDNVTALELAVTNADGDVRISDGVAHERNALTEEDGIEVPARRLDRVAADLGIEHVDLLKMNIEGAEVDALRGAGELLDRTRHVCISCHDFLGVNTKADVCALLASHGFTVKTRGDAAEAWTRDYVYGRKRPPARTVARSPC